jgi:hypothetical protein
MLFEPEAHFLKKVYIIWRSGHVSPMVPEMTKNVLGMTRLP